ncbi:MAG: hypothetical protein IPP15_16995 [Saprospiraceae bacterium]|uniref:Uncharacterized protein n=1 Tax=Candidatus Opimibacter skivensis TaxID=2982028 RepID=A0A9D7SXZ9_9BACT|nr:hypothetical protein [Candidatus Opimibacter skivensis]
MTTDANTGYSLLGIRYLLFVVRYLLSGFSSNTTKLSFGRGDKIKKQWTSHGERIEGADEIWIAAIGPHVHAEGEMKNSSQIYQGQLAATFAAGYVIG